MVPRPTPPPRSGRPEGGWARVAQGHIYLSWNGGGEFGGWCYNYCNMLRKFNSKQDVYLLKSVPFMHDTTSSYLDHAAYVISHNGKEELAVQDALYPNELPYIFLPRSRKLWPNAHILWTKKTDIEKLKKKVEIKLTVPIVSEYMYRTKKFIDLEDSEMKKFRKLIRQFKHNYSYSVDYECDRDQVDQFLTKWSKQQKVKTATFWDNYHYCHYCLDHKRLYGIKTVYVKVEGKLVGIAMGVKFDAKRWVALHIKVDYSYQGLSRFLFHKRAEMFQELPWFTSGSSGLGDKGIEKYKEMLHPDEKIDNFYVITGEKKGSRE